MDTPTTVTDNDDFYDKRIDISEQENKLIIERLNSEIVEMKKLLGEDLYIKFFTKPYDMYNEPFLNMDSTWISEIDELKDVKKKIRKQKYNEDLYENYYNFYTKPLEELNVTNISKIYYSEFHDHQILGGEACEMYNCTYYIPFKNKVIVYWRNE